ncbi:riboflavin synthase subunit alpha [Paraferrimonas haliotis]|uniref:Riboflavin synthase n=1 Tax=Paraferrimonas haliotis TaxID=2013866 RepID=A0AA37U0R1_9GAMM|nr:riboflavin synthase subunit alpha [Paraferrimonas haliotis]GLS84521.1 riboflavin synthase subunit alpha [Paraferrimonas haliotis]
MFTGIVQGTAQIVAIERRHNFQTHVVRLPEALLDGLSIGASVAHNGCCLTVTHINGSDVSFDLMEQTLALTNLGTLEVGDKVNVERAARFGDDIGGHSMSGHIYTTTVISDIERSPDNCRVWFEIPSSCNKFLFDKGYVGIDGCSLTIAQISDTHFAVNLIPETLQRTNLGWREVGDIINLEIDPQTQAIVETVERVLAKR